MSHVYMYENFFEMLYFIFLCPKNFYYINENFGNFIESHCHNLMSHIGHIQRIWSLAAAVSPPCLPAIIDSLHVGQRISYFLYSIVYLFTPLFFFLFFLVFFFFKYLFFSLSLFVVLATWFWFQLERHHELKRLSEMWVSKSNKL